ncbi:MAG: CaiB/BaiF CoA transferase family protein [Pseudomonadota bacterium]
MEYPLAGIRVLDFSRVLAGPFAGRMLSDLGADVIKVEPPEGDVTRYWGKEIARIPGYYHQQNAGKRNVCIDLRAAGAVELVQQLVAQADILIENYRPDVMDRLGIGYDSLRQVNPRLIMLSISGFGRSGPEARRPAYAPVIHAEAGLIDRLATRSGSPHHDLPLSVADTNASLHGLVAVLSAVILRQRTGLGQHIDIAMIDATIATDDQVHYDLEDAHDTGPLPNQVWDTPCGPVLVSTDFRLLWKLLTTELGVVDPSNPAMPLAEKIAVRRAAAHAFMQTLDTWEKLAATMDQLNIAWGEVRNAANLHDQPSVKARNSIAWISDREGGTRPVTQSPYRFSNAMSGVRGPAAHRGEHNLEVLGEWLDLTPERIIHLSEAGVLLEDANNQNNN